MKGVIEQVFTAVLARLWGNHCAVNSQARCSSRCASYISYRVEPCS